MHRLRHIHPLTALGFLAAVVVYIKIAWVTEDAYIIFRSVEQLFAGNGPVWNPHERVQVVTSPLWYWLVAATRLFSGNVFLNAISLGLVLWLACLSIIRVVAGTPGKFLLIVLLLLAANGFTDFTSSGLENSLLYPLLAWFVLLFSRTMNGDGDCQPRGLLWLWLVAGLVLLTRLDQVFLLGPALAGATWNRRGELDRRQWVNLLLVGLGPLGAWMIFSLIYYGFPFPNTALAKLNTGINELALLSQGVKYYLASIGSDTITIAVAGTVIWWGRRIVGMRLLVLGAVLQFAYVGWVGGDFMLGRFLAGPYLVLVMAAVVLTEWRLVNRRAVWVTLVLYLVLFPHTPVNVPLHYPKPKLGLGVLDERGYYNEVLSLQKYVASRREGRVFPDSKGCDEAKAFRDSDELVIVGKNIGVFGYLAGTEKIIVDRLALSDPLLARLPSIWPWRVGHYPREIPAGYVESLVGYEESLGKENAGALEDARLQELYEEVILITRSPHLFSAERWRAILSQRF